VFVSIVSVVSACGVEDLGDAFVSGTDSVVVTELGIPDGAFRRGPRARALVICVS